MSPLSSWGQANEVSRFKSMPMIRKGWRRGLDSSTLASFFILFLKHVIQLLMRLVALCVSLTAIAICEKIGPAQRNDSCAIKKNTHTQYLWRGECGYFYYLLLFSALFYSFLPNWSANFSFSVTNFFFCSSTSFFELISWDQRGPLFPLICFNLHFFYFSFLL